jgi:tRNA modification GTPase
VSEAGGTVEVEIHCHGGTAAVNLVIEALMAGGAKREMPISRTCGTLETEAYHDLARAPTLRAAEILLEQAQGALSREVAEIVRLIGHDRREACSLLDLLIARAGMGLRLVEGWSVVLAGRPNVGKSRLLNALAGYARSIVDPTPGTTRDVVTMRTAFDGWPVELADTAGLRDADEVLESAGIRLARERQAVADLTILVLDRSEPLTAFDRESIQGLRRGLLVANKADLPAAWDVGQLEGALEISAERGDGLDRLVEEAAKRLVAEPPGPGEGVPFREAHLRRLKVGQGALRSGDAGGALKALAWFSD